MRACSRLIIVLFTCIVVFACVTGGLYAQWNYDTADSSGTLSSATHLNEFEYKMEDLTPDDDVVQSLGESHVSLLQLILYEDSKGYGLNINGNKSQVVHSYLESNSILYCDQNISGGNLKFLLDDNSTVNKLYYCIKSISATEYHVFTFKYDDMMKAPIGTEITVYKTVMLKQYWEATGRTEWDDARSYVGMAAVKTSNVAACGRIIVADGWRQTD